MSQWIPARRPVNRSRRRNYHSVCHHQQSQPSCQQQQQPWLSERLRHHRHHHQNHQCYRCGELFHRDHLSHCKARFVRCFACKHFGHFSFMCANIRTHVSHNIAGRSKERNPCKINTISCRQITKRQPDIVKCVKEETVPEVLSLAQELPFANINQAALDPEIVSANDRELKLEKKLGAVMDRMEEEKLLHSTEVMSVLEISMRRKEKLDKCEAENQQLIKRCAELNCQVEKLTSENENCSEFNQMKQQLENLEQDNYLFTLSQEDFVRNLKESRDENEALRGDLENINEQLNKMKEINKVTINTVELVRKEDEEKRNSMAKQMQQDMTNLREERDYLKERYEVYATDNGRAALQIEALREEIRQLKQQRRWPRRN